MNLKRSPLNPILGPDPAHSWETTAVMNASVVKSSGTYHMLYRALADKETQIRAAGRTYHESSRVYHESSIGYASSSDGRLFERRDRPLIVPQFDWEALGCEDARVTEIDGVFYIFYTAVSRAPDGTLRVQIAGASTNDFQAVHKFGPIGLRTNLRAKAAGLFPAKIGGRYGFLYTEDADRSGSAVWYGEFDSIDDLFERGAWEAVSKTKLLAPPADAYRGPELGAVPLRTEAGWLLVYCPASFEREWSIGAALLDHSEPRRVLAVTSAPLLRPQADYEKRGYVAKVAFPAGALVEGDELLVYYGAADMGVCLASGSLAELLATLTDGAQS